MDPKIPATDDPDNIEKVKEQREDPDESDGQGTDAGPEPGDPDQDPAPSS